MAGVEGLNLLQWHRSEAGRRPHGHGRVGAAGNPVARAQQPGTVAGPSVVCAGESRGRGNLHCADIGVADHARGEALDDLQLLWRDLHRLQVGGVAADLLWANDQRIEAQHMPDDIAMHVAKVAPGHHALAHMDGIGAENA